MNIFLDYFQYCYLSAFPLMPMNKTKNAHHISTKGILVSRNKLQILDVLNNLMPSATGNMKLKSYRKVFKKVLQTAKKLSIIDKIKKSNNKIKTTWRIIGEQTKKNTRKPEKNKEIKDPQTKAVYRGRQIPDAFNNFFVNVAKKLTEQCQSAEVGDCEQYLNLMNQPKNKICFSLMTSQELARIIRSLKNKKSRDYYDMDVESIKKLILQNDLLFDLLLNILNCCISQGIFPDSLKIGKVVPVFKKGAMDEIGNYRPVCILPVISKILETALKSRMVEYLESNCLIRDCQYGFRNKRSTEMAITRSIKFILEALDGSQRCTSIFCDLSKAFDCLRHDILLHKLRYYGFEGKEYSILKSYLQNREQVVSVNELRSKRETCNIGVPQGSILGPLLFLIYVNDLEICLPEWASVTLFADDTHIVIKDKKEQSLVDKRNYVFDKIKRWFDINGIILNESKSTILNYKCTLKAGERSEDAVFLGCRLDSTLTFEKHIENLCKKLSSANYALFKLKPLIDKKTLISVYYAYCHSLINYAITIWGSATAVKRVLLCQKRSIRIIDGLPRLASVRAHFAKSRIMTVINIFVFRSLLEIHAQKENLLRKKDVHHYNTRNKEKLIIPKVRLQKVYNLGINLKIKLYNKLPASVVDLPFKEFEYKIKYFLERHPFYCISEFMTSSFL